MISRRGIEGIRMSNPAFRKTITTEDIFKADAQERRLYEMKEKAYLDAGARIETAEKKGIAKGKAVGKSEAVCQYLEARFGVDSQALQDTIRLSTDLDTLNQITNRIFKSFKRSAGFWG